MPAWADDSGGSRAEQCGYVNGVIADDELDEEVSRIASRLARFDHDAIARARSYGDRGTLPADSELPPVIARLDELIVPLVTVRAPGLLSRYGVGRTPPRCS
jgi:enoyl-CoA hydratase/carnithine racemase